MKILDIAFNDLTRSFRSAFAIGMMVVAPLMLTALIYFAFGGASNGTSSLPAVTVGIVNADKLPANAALEQSLGGNIRSMFFDDSVKSWITASDYSNETEARTAVDRQEINVAVIIPQNFTEHFLNGQKDAQVTIVNDPTLTIAPSVVENMINSMLDGVSGGGVAVETLMERQQANGLAPDPAQIPNWMDRYVIWYKDFQRNMFHHPDKAALVVVAPSVGETETEDPIKQIMGITMAGQMIFFAFFTGANSMISILRDDEEGTLSRIFSTPTDRTAILTGKFLAVFITVFLQGIVLIIAGRFAFDISWGEPAAVALALVGQVLAATGLGVLLISFVKNTRQAGPVLGGGLTALGMLGGLFTASMPNAMPEAFTRIANFTPQGWVLKTWRMVMSGQPVSDLFVPFLVMAGLGTIMFIIGALMFRKRYS